MTSVAEPAPVDAAEHSMYEEVSVGAPAEVTQDAVSEEQKQETNEAAALEVSPIQATPASIAADVQIHVPYQVDFFTPHPSIRANQALSNGASCNTNATVNEGKVTGARNPSAGASPAAGKIMGRPSQAPLHAAQVAARTTRNGTAGRSASQCPPQRSQRRQPATVGYGTRPTAATTCTSNNASVLPHRPRFVDPMASTAALTTATTPAATPAEPSAERASRLARPIGSNQLASTLLPPNTTTFNATNSAAVASHTTLYIHSIPHHNPTRTPQRAPVTVDAAAAGAHHRRRLLSSTRSTGSVHRNGAISPSPVSAVAVATSLGSTAMKAKNQENNNGKCAVVPASEEGGRTVSPSSGTVKVTTTKAESEYAESEKTIDVRKKEENDTQNPVAAAAAAKEAVPAAPAVTEGANPSIKTTVAAANGGTTKPASHHVQSTRDSQVKVMPATVVSHPDKKVIQSRPTSSQYALRMSELTRPSEAYKISLNSSLQSSALARRSRQPRKVLNVSLTKYPVIRKLADELGWVMETTEEELNEYKFNLCWSDTVLSLMRLVRLSNWQRTNHFPSMYLLCRKGHLGTTLGKLRHKLPSHFAFYPRTWSMRSERLQFTQYMAAVRQRHILKYFIMKPNSGCQGRGIIVARDPLTALDEHTLDNYIVQEYVHRPLLLEGKKFDLRVYVLLTSIRHPSIFLFNDGLVRICTEQYETPTEENVKNACKHLTNYAVNKKSSEYVFNTDVEHMDVGNKRNFAFLNRWLEESGYSSAELWNQVGAIIVKTILSAQPSIARVYNSCFPTGFNDGYCCFEVLGFDILIDHKMRPWLMEVNHTPSFATETPLDLNIKSKLLTEVWNIIDCKATDYEKDRQRERDEFTKRNMPPWTSNHPLYGSQLSQSGARHGAIDDVESPVNVNSPLKGTLNGANDIPSYVQPRRAHEDSKLRNFKRIYPSEDPELQLIYDTIQNLALAESANSRLYYNSTVAAPVVSPTTANSSSVAPFGVRNSNSLSLRPRPPSLGTVLTTSRAHSATGSPNTTVPQRNLTSPVTPSSATIAAAMAPSNSAPATISVSSVPSLAVVRDSHQTSSSASNGVLATSPHGTSPIAKSRASAMMRRESNVSSRLSATPSVTNDLNSANAAAPPLSSASLANAEPDVKRDGSRASTSTTPKAASTTVAAAQPVRAFTPHVTSPVVNSRTTTAASTPSSGAANARQINNTTTGAVAGTPPTPTTAKPRVAEVHRRAPSRPSNAFQNTPTLQDLTPEENLNQASKEVTATTTTAAEAVTTTPDNLSLSHHKPTPSKVDNAEANLTTNSPSKTYHQNGSVVTPPVSTEAQKAHASGPTFRITRTSVGRQKSPSLEAPINNNKNNVEAPLSSSLTKRHSPSISGVTRDVGDVVAAPVVAHPRQKSVDRDGRSMTTHPEPTEEELARLVALQAQLDYEAAADPEPDDEDEDYNLTE